MGIPKLISNRNGFVQPATREQRAMFDDDYADQFPPFEQDGEPEGLLDAEYDEKGAPF